jgi:hypothetical protein
MVAGSAWDHLPKEIVSLITVKVSETSEGPLKDLCSGQQKDEGGNLEPHHRQSLQPRATLPIQGLGGADVLNAYLQTVDWLQGVNNGVALFIKGMADICMGRPGGVALLS